MLRTLELMREDHPSAPRIFSVVRVLPMNADEVAELFHVGLRGTGIQVEADAIELAAAYSSGLPDRAQAVAEQARSSVRSCTRSRTVTLQRTY